MKKMFKFVGSGIAALVLASNLSSATEISIQNPGFEQPDTTSTGTPPAFWDVTGGTAGVWDISTWFPGVYFSSTTAPDGSSQVAYLALGPRPGSPATLSQVLSASLAADTVYTLSGYVGHPLGFAGSGASTTIWTAALYAGNQLLASVQGNGPEGSLAPFSFTWDSTGSSFVGQTLQIKLQTSLAQTVFDTISLDAARKSVPETGFTLTLLFMGLLALNHVRRTLK